MMKPTVAPETIPGAPPEVLQGSAPDDHAARIEAIEKQLTEIAAATYTPAPTDPLAGLIRGRIVWYTPLPSEARYADAGPWAAMVVHVGPLPGQCTLIVFLPAPTQIGADPCARRPEVPFSASGEPGSWNWPERI